MIVIDRSMIAIEFKRRDQVPWPFKSLMPLTVQIFCGHQFECNWQITRISQCKAHFKIGANAVKFSFQRYFRSNIQLLHNNNRNNMLVTAKMPQLADKVSNTNTTSWLRLVSQLDNCRCRYSLYRFIMILSDWHRSTVDTSSLHA